MSDLDAGQLSADATAAEASMNRAGVALADDGAAGAPRALPFIDQINLVHTALFGWPCDHLTPLDEYLGCWDIHEVGVRMIDSTRFRWDIRSRVAPWPVDKWVMTEFKGFKLWVNLHDGFVSFGVLHGDWEEAEVEFMLSCLGPGDGMIDAGANVGVYTVQAAAAVGSTGRIYAFEPNPTVCQRLRLSLEANRLDDRCALYNEGLGAAESTGSFHLSQHAANPGSSTISTGDSGAPILIRPIDSIQYERPIRFIKMDVEGFEPFVLQGARKTLERHRPVILTEFFPRSLSAIAGASGSAYIGMLEALGYSMTVFAARGDGEAVTSSDASRFDAIAEPINLVCRPMARQA